MDDNLHDSVSLALELGSAYCSLCQSPFLTGLSKWKFKIINCSSGHRWEEENKHTEVTCDDF